MFDKGLFKLDGAKRFTALCAVLAVLEALSTIGIASFLAICVVEVWSGKQIDSIYLYLLFFIVCFIARALIEFASKSVSERFASGSISNLRNRFLESLFTLGPSALSHAGSASLAAETINGMDVIENYLSISIPKMVNMVVIPLSLAVAIFMQDWISGLIVVISYPLIILFMRLIGLSAAADSKKRHDGFMRMSDHFMDSVRGLDTLRTFGASKAYAKTIFAASEAYRKMTMKVLRIATLSSTVLDIFATLSLAAVAIMLGFRMVEGSISFLPALIVLVLVPEFYRPIRRFAADNHASLDGKTSLGFVNDIIADADMRAMKALENSSIFDTASVSEGLDEVLRTKTPSTTTANEDASTSRELILSDISYTSDSGVRILDDISFHIHPQEKIAIVGSSGSGKTTLLNILSGFTDPESGTFELPGATCMTLNFDHWKKRVAYIPQKPYLFDATIRENVGFYRPAATDDEIMCALSRVRLAKIVAAMPLGLDTPISHEETLLSGGEAQRLALARALLDDRRDVWILDEPTEHLDIETEFELKDTLIELMADKTVLLVTHRMSWLNSMQTVLTLEDGHLVSCRPVEHTSTMHVCDTSQTSSSDICDETRVTDVNDGTKVVDAPDVLVAKETSAARTSAWRRIVSISGATFAGIAAIVILQVIANAFGSGLMFTSGYMISLAATIPFTVLALHVPSIFVRIFGIGKPLIQYFQRLKSHDWILRATSHMRTNLFRAADGSLDAQGDSVQGGSAQGNGGHIKKGSTEMFSLFADVIEHVQNLYLRGVFPYASLIVTWILGIVLLAIFSATAALMFALLVGVIVIVLPVVSSVRQKRGSADIKQLRHKAFIQATDDSFGLADWVLSGRIRDYVHHNQLTVSELRMLNAERSRRERIRSLLCNVVFCALVVGLFVWAATSFAPDLSGATTPGVMRLSNQTAQDSTAYAPNWIAAFVLCLFPLAEVFFPAADCALEIMDKGKTIDSIGCVLDPDSAVSSDVEKPHVSDFASSAKVGAVSASRKGAESGDDVYRIENVKYSYPGSGKDAFACLDLRIKPGEHIAVVGKSGSGKSTLLKLLEGPVKACEGTILMCGKDLRTDGENVRDHVVALEQSPHIFHQTIRDNLLIANPSATDDQLIYVLQSVDLTELIDRDEAGLDAMISENARNLSGGEQERLALARMLLSGQPVVLLDEPFSGLDAACASSVMDTLFDAFADKTLIVVTHNLQDIDKFDRIIVMDDGRIVEDGTCEEVSARNPHFKDLLDFQR